jgi:hypothetical protein
MELPEPLPWSELKLAAYSSEPTQVASLHAFSKK